MTSLRLDWGPVSDICDSYNTEMVIEMKSCFDFIKKIDGLCGGAGGREHIWRWTELDGVRPVVAYLVAYSITASESTYPTTTEINVLLKTRPQRPSCYPMKIVLPRAAATSRRNRERVT